VKEKLSQIELMSEVYKNAVEVRIWLGSLNEVQEVIETSRLRPVSIPGRSCSRLSTEEDIGAVLRCKKKRIEIALLAAKDYVMNKDRLLGQEAHDNWFPDEPQALGIRLVAMQPWWRRVWVIQEATLSQEDPVMQCGDIQIGYRKFLEAAKPCIFHLAPSILSQPYISLIVHGMFKDKYKPLETSPISRLLTYLSCMGGNFESSDHKDRVYGVYGLLYVKQELYYDSLSLIRPRYEQTDHEFFHRVAVWILVSPQPQSYPLRILESGPSNIEGIPSWVPMWKSRKWSGDDKTHGAPESRYDILARGISIKEKWHGPSIGLCNLCSAEYSRKWGTPKISYDSVVRCTEMEIHNALALGRVITTLRLLPIPEREDTDVLREAILGVEERILAALRLIPHADAKRPIQKFREYLRINFWNMDRSEGLCSSERKATLEEFLGCKRKSKKRKGQRHSSKVSADQADPKVPSPFSVAKLSTFFECSRDLVVGSKIVGHIFEDEDSLPCWQSGDKLCLIPECRWVLGLRRNGSGYRYMYRVFISDLTWQQRKHMFDAKAVYEDLSLK
jgi:hypothetical protein